MISVLFCNAARELRGLVVLKISRVPCLASASANVSAQNAASMVIDPRHARTHEKFWDITSLSGSTLTS